MVKCVILGIVSLNGITSYNVPDEIPTGLETEELAEAIGMKEQVKAIDVGLDGELLDVCISYNKPSNDANSCSKCGMVCHAVSPCTVTSIRC